MCGWWTPQIYKRYKRQASCPLWCEQSCYRRKRYGVIGSVTHLLIRGLVVQKVQIFKNFPCKINWVSVTWNNCPNTCPEAFQDNFQVERLGESHCFVHSCCHKWPYLGNSLELSANTTNHRPWPQALSLVSNTLVSSTREKYILWVVAGHYWLAPDEIGCKKVAAPKTFYLSVLVANKLPWLPAVCIEKADSSANSCWPQAYLVKHEKAWCKLEMDTVYLQSKSWTFWLQHTLFKRSNFT